MPMPEPLRIGLIAILGKEVHQGGKKSVHPGTILFEDHKPKFVVGHFQIALGFQLVSADGKIELVDASRYLGAQVAAQKGADVPGIEMREGTFGQKIIALVPWVKGPVQGKRPIPHQLRFDVQENLSTALAVQVGDGGRNIGEKEILRCYTGLQSFRITERAPGYAKGIDL